MSEEVLKGIFLVATPYPTVIILIVYLYIVLIHGPSYMRNKKPYELKSVILVYDVVQIFMNLYLLSTAYAELRENKYEYTCLIASKTFLQRGYICYLVKMLDLFETIIFVLKKKENQISFLHVYHHVIVFFFAYVVLNSIAAGHALIIAIVNCIVHVIMYIYYFISAYNPESKWMKMKKFVTQLQLLQFCIVLIHYSWPLYFGHCCLPRFFIWLGITQSLTMIYLFDQTKVIQPTEGNAYLKHISIYATGTVTAAMEDIKTQYESMKAEVLKDKFLVATPYPTIIILASYLYFVLKCGPAYMKNRKPYELRFLVLVYNVVQIFMNLYMLYSAYLEMTAHKYDFFCLIATAKMLNIGYIYYSVKVLDLIETIIFVLKKKHNQISFLHVYHHVLVLSFSYWGMHVIAAGHGIVYGVINCFVHAIMYVYYFISAFNPNSKWMKMKKFVTQIQLLQFVILFFHYLWPIIFGHCCLLKVYSFFGISQAITMMYLFGKFYLNTYIKKK